MNVTTKKVIVQPAVEEVSKDVVVLEMSKREAAALFALWYTCEWEYFNAWNLRGYLQPNIYMKFLNQEAYEKKLYSRYHVCLTKEAKQWIKSFPGE